MKSNVVTVFNREPGMVTLQVAIESGFKCPLPIHQSSAFAKMLGWY